MQAHVKGQPPPLDVPHRPLPTALRSILEACFRSAPLERPSAAVLFRQLCNARHEILQQAVRSHTSTCRDAHDVALLPHVGACLCG